MKGSKALTSSARDDWETPTWLFDQLNSEFDFTLDAAADSRNHKCEKYFSINDDGLSMSWGGERVFCNPPYGRGVGVWLEKAHNEVLLGDCPLAVLLVAARTDTIWFHDFVLGKADIRFVRGRIKFGGSNTNAPFPSMIVIYKKEESDWN
jgi:site-specific DNA-methyltransferase (adenine-specific)